MRSFSWRLNSLPFNAIRTTSVSKRISEASSKYLVILWKSDISAMNASVSATKLSFMVVATSFSTQLHVLSTLAMVLLPLLCGPFLVYLASGFPCDIGWLLLRYLLYCYLSPCGVVTCTLSGFCLSPLTIGMLTCYLLTC